MFNISNDRGTETTPAVKILGPGTASTGSGGSSKFNFSKNLVFSFCYGATTNSWKLMVEGSLATTVIGY